MAEFAPRGGWGGVAGVPPPGSTHDMRIDLVFRASNLIDRREPLRLTLRADAPYSQISLRRNLDRHRAVRARPLPARLGGSVFHDPAPFRRRRGCRPAVRVLRRAGIGHD